MKWNIPLFKIFSDEQDYDLIHQVIKRGSYWTTGPEVEKFEQEVAKYVGLKYAVSFTNGTAALHAAMLAYGIGKDDEVIVPSFTFISTANVPLFVGAKPVFAEIDTETYGLDPEDVEKRITSKTKAIMPVHVGGAPCLIEELKEIAEKHDLLLIEDAAEAFGAKVHGKMVGTHGDIAMYSFCQNKIITTGEGGMLVTDDKDIYNQLKLLRSHGRADDADYFSKSETNDYISLGYNFRMSSITAALGLAQMSKVDKIIEMRRNVAQQYNKNLGGISQITLPIERPGCFNVYQLYTIMLESQEIRDKLKSALTKDKIMTKVYFDPIHLMKHYQNMGYTIGELPQTEDIAKRVLTLPLYPEMNEEEVSYVTKSIRNPINKISEG